MLGLGNALNKVKSLVPKVVNAGNKAVKTAVKKVADSALGRAVASIPSAVRTGAAKVGQITRKAVAAIPKIIEPVKKKVVENAVQIKNSVTAKATQIKSAVNAGIGQANQAIVNKSNQVKQTVGQIQNVVELKVNEFNTVTEQKDKRIVEKMKAEWENNSSDLIRGVILTGAFPNRFSIRSSSLLLDFMLKFRRSVIEEYPILEFPFPVFRGPLNFLRNDITKRGTVAGSFVYNQNIPGVSDFVGELTNQRGPGAQSNIFSIVGARARGFFVKGQLETQEAIINLIGDPLTVFEGLNSIVAHPDETVPVICKEVMTYLKEKVINGSPEDRAELDGQIMYEVISDLIMAGAAESGVTTSKAVAKTAKAETIGDLGIVAKEGAQAVIITEGGDVLTDTAKITKKTEMIREYFSRFKKNVMNKIDSSGSHNVTIKPKVQLEDIPDVVKKSDDGIGVITEGAGKLKPSLTDGSKPIGKYSPPNSPGLIRQNETADLLASKGYKVEMLEEVPGGNGYGIKPNSNPDFLIEDKVFDCYAPKVDTNTKGIVKEIYNKTKKQTPNIVVNLDDYAGNIPELTDSLLAKIDGDLKYLQELYFVKDGEIIHIFGR